MMIDEGLFKEYNKTLIHILLAILLITSFGVIIFYSGLMIAHHFDMIEQEIYDRFMNRTNGVLGVLLGFTFALMLVAMNYLDYMAKINTNERKAEISKMRKEIDSLRNSLLENEQTIEVLRDQLKDKEPTESSQDLQTDETDKEYHD